MEERLVILTTDDPTAARAAQRQIQADARVTQRYGPYVLILDIAPEHAQALETYPGVVGSFEDRVPDDFAGRLDEVGRLGVAAWNERHSAPYRAAKRQRRGEGRPWDDPDAEPEG